MGPGIRIFEGGAGAGTFPGRDIGDRVGPGMPGDRAGNFCPWGIVLFVLRAMSPFINDRWQEWEPGSLRPAMPETLCLRKWPGGHIWAAGFTFQGPLGGGLPPLYKGPLQLPGSGIDCPLPGRVRENRGADEVTPLCLNRGVGLSQGN